jgi:hypothetical protein
MRAFKACCSLAVLLLFTSSAAAQTRQKDPEETVVSDLVVTAPTQGPAWWKVSKGDSVVWIIGLPDVSVVKDTDWDEAVFRRRVRGAKAFLASPQAMVEFPNSPQVLDIPRQARVAVTAAEIGFNPDNYWPTGLGAVMRLRQSFQQTYAITLRVEERMVALARRAGTPIVRHDQPTITLREEDLLLDDPEILTCVDAVLDEVETPVEAYRANAQHWAQGRAFDFLAGPRGAWPKCLNRMMPGTSRRVIEDQTAAIAAALQTPGKAVAAASIRLLVAEDGVIERLRAQGFTVADPSKPLSE